MSVRTEPWPSGTPCWVDVASSDPAAASGFYRDLLGWEVREGPAGSGGYRMAFVSGQVVAGIRQGGAAGWTVYLASDDMRQTLDAVIAAGGRVLTPPTALLGEAVMAVVEDPGGAVFGVWQPLDLIGARMVNEPGAFCWDELMTSEYAAARAFYTEVFGFRYADHGASTHAYSMLRIDAATVGGIGAIGPGPWPESPHWLVYFSVDDADGVASRAAGLGGHVRVAPTDTPLGRMAVLQGPERELFAVLQADDLPRSTRETPETTMV
ncbi:MAG: VOC family protein [Actinomycetota bacterium]|nr:VOC family protein [Actinomycetota bacterium]